jgi:hypothetical protein
MDLKKYSRDITPDTSLLPKSGQVNYTIPDAVGELVDNEIDARITGKLLTIEVYIGTKGDGMIQVKGNGKGMDGETLATALKMGYSRKGGSDIGEFGLGLKTACTNLGRHFEIVTVPSRGDRGYKVVYDEKAFRKADKWEVEIEEVEKPFDHGTMITITKPKVSIYGGVSDILSTNLSRIFRHFLKGGAVEVYVNGEPVVVFESDLQEGYTQEIDFEINGKRVRGWYGLQKKFSAKTGYGFELIRHSRIVKRHEKLGFPAHPKHQHIVGELYLDEFQVVNNKTDFIRDTEDWRKLEEKMREIMRPLVDMAARKYQAELTPKDLVRAADVKDKIETALRSEEFARSLDHRLLSDALKGELAPVEKRKSPNGKKPSSPDTVETPEAATEKRLRTPKEVHDVLRRTRMKLLNLNIEHITVKFGPEALYKWWEEDGLGEARKLIVSSNLDHPMFTAVDDTVTWIKHNIAEAAAEFLSKETGLTMDMLKIKSDLLRHVSALQVAEEMEKATA